MMCSAASVNQTGAGFSLGCSFSQQSMNVHSVQKQQRQELYLGAGTAARACVRAFVHAWRRLLGRACGPAASWALAPLLRPLSTLRRLTLTPTFLLPLLPAALRCAHAHAPLTLPAAPAEPRRPPLHTFLAHPWPALLPAHTLPPPVARPQMNLLDRAIKLAAEQDEPLEMNFVRKHALQQARARVEGGRGGRGAGRFPSPSWAPPPSRPPALPLVLHPSLPWRALRPFRRLLSGRRRGACLAGRLARCTA